MRNLAFSIGGCGFMIAGALLLLFGGEATLLNLYFVRVFLPVFGAAFLIFGILFIAIGICLNNKD